MDLSIYSNLSDNMECKELRKEFEILLNYFDTVEMNVSAIECSSALLELADRQWHTYELLDEGTRIRIEKWIEKVWDVSLFDFVDNILSVISYLGLENSYELVKESLKTQLSNKIRELIEETIIELDGQVKNPYSGMDKKY